MGNPSIIMLKPNARDGEQFGYWVFTPREVGTRPERLVKDLPLYLLTFMNEAEANLTIRSIRKFGDQYQSVELSDDAAHKLKRLDTL